MNNHKRQDGDSDGELKRRSFWPDNDSILFFYHSSPITAVTCTGNSYNSAISDSNLESVFDWKKRVRFLDHQSLSPREISRLARVPCVTVAATFH